MERFILLAIFTLFVVACGGPEVTGNTEASEISTSEVTSEVSNLAQVGCLSDTGILSMKTEWEANSDATEAKYADQSLCIQTKIAGFNEDSMTVSVGGPVGGSILAVSHYVDWVPPGMDKEQENARADDLRLWLKNQKEGDLLKAQCTVDQFISNDQSTFDIGTPLFENCVLIK